MICSSLALCLSLFVLYVFLLFLSFSTVVLFYVLFAEVAGIAMVVGSSM